MEVKETMEFMDMHDDVIEDIFKRLHDTDLVNVAYTCKRLQQIVRYVFSQKYKNPLKMISPDATEVSLRVGYHTHRPCPSIESVVRIYPHIEVLHLDMYDSLEELVPIALRLTRLRELDLKIYVIGYNHIFYSEERIERMLCIAFEKKLPIERLKMDMEFGYAVNMLWMISENLPQLKELELHFRYVACIGDVEDEDCLRLKTVEKLTIHCAESATEGLAIQSIAMFDFDELKEFALYGFRDPPDDLIEFIIKQKKLEKLKFIESVNVSVEVFNRFVKKLPQLKEIVVDVNEQLLKRHLGDRWIVSNHSDSYKLKKVWRIKSVK